MKRVGFCLRRVGVFFRERFIAQRWWLLRVVRFVFVGHGWQRFEEGLDLNSDGAKGGLEVVGKQQ